jgi:hypothetical protein
VVYVETIVATVCTITTTVSEVSIGTGSRVEARIAIVPSVAQTEVAVLGLSISRLLIETMWSIL